MTEDKDSISIVVVVYHQWLLRKQVLDIYTKMPMTPMNLRVMVLK